MQFAPIAKAREVREFQVVQEGPTLNVRVVLHPDADARGLERRLTGELAANLRELGVSEPAITFKPCEQLERDAATMGKLRLVVADPGMERLRGSGRPAS
jgi:phenylacetate-coenzyme A ligase PaaK-like adenylate-forming protein